MDTLKPAKKFINNTTLEEQFDHIAEELQEAEEALFDFKERYTKPRTLYHLAEEICDIQMACETFLAILGLNEIERDRARLKVIAKNIARGYCNECPKAIEKEIGFGKD